MKCPFCKNVLVQGKNRKYETICDHVSNPNAEDYPLRPSFECECTPDGFWDAQGGFYGWSPDKSHDFKYSFSEKFTDVAGAGAFAEEMRTKHYGKFAGFN